jgi:tetrahydromethanopterin S-methyltransferase subunit G
LKKSLAEKSDLLTDDVDDAVLGEIRKRLDETTKKLDEVGAMLVDHAG